MKPNMWVDFLRYHALFFSGKIRFYQINPGEEFSFEDGRAFKTFLYVANQEKMKSKTKRAKLKVSFQVKRMSLYQKKILPLASTPFFAGCPGFVSKKFMVCESQNTFQGYYEWESEQALKDYLSSYAMQFMLNNSLPGTLHYQIESPK